MLFNDFRTITECFILAEGYFSFWLRVILTFLPLFCSSLKPSFSPSPKALLRADILAFSLFKKDQTFFPPLSLKHFSIRSPLSLSVFSPLLPLYPLIGHFHLKGPRCLNDSMSEKALPLPPSPCLHSENGFWVVDCNGNSLCSLSERRKSGCANSVASIS